MSWAAVFSGQGALLPDHVAWLLEHGEAGGVEVLLNVLGLTAGELRSLTATALQVNRVAQPVITCYQLARWGAVAGRIPPPAAVAGYSVGEIAAVAAAGGSSVGTAIRLAASRAALMDAATSHPAGLVAVLGLHEAALHLLTTRHGVAIAIRNGAAHFVVGGSVERLAEFSDAARKVGAERVVRLPVTVASHTAAMAEAAHQFAATLAAADLSPPRWPVLSAIDGRTLRTAADIRKAAAAQLAERLDWQSCLATLVERAPAALLEIGPGHALARMAEAVGITARALEEFASAGGAPEWLAAKLSAH